MITLHVTWQKRLRAVLGSGAWENWGAGVLPSASGGWGKHEDWFHELIIRRVHGGGSYYHGPWNFHLDSASHPEAARPPGHLLWWRYCNHLTSVRALSHSWQAHWDCLTWEQISLTPICNVGNPGRIPGSGRSSGEGNRTPLQYPCLENPMDRGAWYATVHGVSKSWAQLSDFPFLFL